MIIIKILSVFSPWFIKRRLLSYFLNYSLDKNAYIGFSWFFPKMLVMKEFSYVGNFNVAVNLDLIEMMEYSVIVRENWITGFSNSFESRHFIHQKSERRSSLTIGAHSAITKKHHIDCTNQIQIGRFSTVAGYNSQFLTHSIDIINGRQHSKPITIGDYCFVSTNTIILGGALLPAYSVLGASSLLNKDLPESYCLYAGNPAKKIKNLPMDAKYFKRDQGFVW